MVQGFNHNVVYKGQVFHVQTEDSGIATPRITTLLYKDGVIIGSRKTSYADILKIENLAAVVGELMKDQHKEMMRRLKSGEFDQRAFPAATPAGDDTRQKMDQNGRGSDEASGLDTAISSIFGADEK